MQKRLFISVGTTEFDRLMDLLDTPAVVEVLRRVGVGQVFLQLGR